MEHDYPHLNPTEVGDFINTVVQFGATEESVRGFLTRVGARDLDVAREIDAVVHDIMADCGDDLDRNVEPVEARHCGRVFAIIDRLPDRALGDPEFWSFLAIRHFWRFIEARQHGAWNAVRGEPRNPDEPDSERQKLERYLIGKDHYQIPLRMYLRAQAVRTGDDFSLTEIPAGGTDFWRSQVLGVRTSQYPAVARSVARSQAVAQLDIEKQRPAGRRVNRLRANIEFFTHEDGDAEPIIDDLWRVAAEDEAAAGAKKAKKAAAKKAPAKKSAAKKATAKKEATKKAPAKKAPAKKSTARTKKA